MEAFVDDTLSVKWFGAKGDMKEYYVVKGFKKHYRGNVVKDHNILSLTSFDAPPLTSGDNDKVIVIWPYHAVADGLRLITKIKKVTGNQIELYDNALDNISGAYVAWGTDKINAIQDAINVAGETGYTIYLPPGHFVITDTLYYNTYQDLTNVASS